MNYGVIDILTVSLLGNDERKQLECLARDFQRRATRAQGKLFHIADVMVQDLWVKERERGGVGDLD